MTTKQDLIPWLQNAPYLWWAIGFTSLLATIPVYIVVVLWEERKILTGSLRYAWDVMTYNVKDD